MIWHNMIWYDMTYRDVILHYKMAFVMTRHKELSHRMSRGQKTKHLYRRKEGRDRDRDSG
jgi:hypothetical protein